MKYISLGNRQEKYNLKEVLFRGLAPDGNLFMPESIPTLDASFFKELPHMDLPEMGFHVLSQFMSEDLSDDVLKQITKETFSFDIPLKKVEEGVYVLELFHGPTQAFKDVGARCLSRLLGHFNKGESRKLMVLTATSGDTGGAVAHGFHRVPGVEVVVLYPYGKVSPYQEYQITGPGDNVHAIAVDGSFDDCQRLVKEAFNDQVLREQIYMTSANSINIGRLVPQSVYYFQVISQLRRMGIEDAPVITVPSGNFGNITAAMLATRMGLPVKRFIAATNANDVVPRFLKSGKYDPQATIPTVANAMDVGDPSNFSRMFDLFRNDIDDLRKNLISSPVSDDEIKSTIVEVYKSKGYLMDPHTASAYAVVKKERKDDETAVFVSTAHPFKFNEVIDQILPGELNKSGYSIDFEIGKNVGKDIMPAFYKEFRSRIEKMA
ncbi:threonine synthase [Alkalitalea saponilacus]|uniref:Threonine synthase n=1 Tax=Alkalitalea saponilacus TaxID=889453 RepID=A0A1T5DAJ7_9BACT|nr:threonine synthase [Alkalitalea saponilacus]ASB50639.1 threonine synthase [Alkalitalea saponilacus]SKB68631.1 threonine synthase [Alkalitalea saponilacus]